MKSTGSGWECLEIEVHEYIAAVNLKEKEKSRFCRDSNLDLGIQSPEM